MGRPQMELSPRFDLVEARWATGDDAEDLEGLSTAPHTLTIYTPRNSPRTPRTSRTSRTPRTPCKSLTGVTESSTDVSFGSNSASSTDSIFMQSSQQCNDIMQSSLCEFGEAAESDDNCSTISESSDGCESDFGLSDRQLQELLCKDEQETFGSGDEWKPCADPPSAECNPSADAPKQTYLPAAAEFTFDARWMPKLRLQHSLQSPADDMDRSSDASLKRHPERCDFPCGRVATMVTTPSVKQPDIQHLQGTFSGDTDSIDSEIDVLSDGPIDIQTQLSDGQAEQPADRARDGFKSHMKLPGVRDSQKMDAFEMSTRVLADSSPECRPSDAPLKFSIAPSAPSARAVTPRKNRTKAFVACLKDMDDDLAWSWSPPSERSTQEELMQTTLPENISAKTELPSLPCVSPRQPCSDASLWWTDPRDTQEELMQTTLPEKIFARKELPSLPCVSPRKPCSDASPWWTPRDLWTPRDTQEELMQTTLPENISAKTELPSLPCVSPRQPCSEASLWWTDPREAWTRYWKQTLACTFRERS